MKITLKTHNGNITVYAKDRTEVFSIINRYLYHKSPHYERKIEKCSLKSVGSN